MAPDRHVLKLARNLHFAFLSAAGKLRMATLELLYLITDGIFLSLD